MSDLFFIKFLFILLFAFLYFILYKRINHIEEKIVFWYFFTFLYVGGSITALIFDYTDSALSGSGMKIVETNITTWLIFFFITFLIPYLCIFAFKIIMYKKSYLTVHNKTNPLTLFFIATITLFYIFLNIDLGEILSAFKEINSYTDWIVYRNQLEYTGIFYFVAKALAFVVLLSLSFEYYFRDRKQVSFILFIIGISIFSMVEHFLFATKGLMFNFALGYLVVVFIHAKLRKTILLALTLFVLFIFYYAYNMSGSLNYEATRMLSPLVSGLTRFTLSTPAFIEYYMAHDFDMRIYFHSIFIGENIVSPNIKVYSMLFDNTIDLGDGIYGSLTNSMFTYNYSNFGLFSIFKSVFEFSLLILLYKYFIVKNSTSSIKLAILVFLLFNVLNFEFVTILVNPVVGFFAFALFYFVKAIAFPQTVLKRR